MGMISRLRGLVAHIDSKYLILDISGVGYKIFAPDDMLQKLKGNEKARKEAIIWTYLAVRDDALDLYGFLSKKEKDFFELLLTVSGIGPKSAQNILSLASYETLSNAIRSGSLAHLVKVSGIGKKTAEKIILELKDKMALFGSERGEHGEHDESSSAMYNEIDAIEALKALGYSAEEAREALKKVSVETKETKDKVKAALKILNVR